MSCVPVMILLKNTIQVGQKDRCKGIIKIKAELSKRENKNNTYKYTKKKKSLLRLKNKTEGMSTLEI